MRDDLLLFLNRETGPHSPMATNVAVAAAVVVIRLSIP